MEVAGGGDEDVGLVGRIVHGDDAIAFHRRLQRADGVALGDPDLRGERTQRLRRALAHVAVAGHDRDLAGDHHVGGALDAVDQRLTAAIQIVELALGDRVVDVDRRELQHAVLSHLVQALDPGGGLLGHALDLGQARRVPGRILGQRRLDRLEQLDFLFRGRVRQAALVLLRLRAQVQQQRGIAAVVEDHVAVAVVGPLEDAVRVVPVVGQRLALDRKHGGAVGGNRGGGVILGRIDVAAGPAHLGAKRLQRLDQHRGLDRHVQRSGDAGAAQRLGGGVFLADRHQTGHLGLGDADFLAAPVGQLQVGDDEVVRGGGFHDGAHLAPSFNVQRSGRAPLEPRPGGHGASSLAGRTAASQRSSKRRRLYG